MKNYKIIKVTTSPPATKKTINPLIRQLAKQLKEKKWSLVTAESCTAGGLAYFISQIPAASTMLERALVTYSDEAKEELLKVKKITLKKYGPVSKQVAVEMATGALRNSHAQLAIALTGLAGPNTDGKSGKSVGTVYISCATKKNVWVVHKKFNGSHQAICYKSIITALQLAGKCIK